MITFLIVAGTILITSLLTACFIVGGIEYLCQKIEEKKNKKDSKKKC